QGHLDAHGDALGHAADGVRLLELLDRRGARARALGDPGTGEPLALGAGARTPGHRGRRGARGDEMNAEFFIGMAYGAAALAVVAEIVLLKLRRARALARIEEERDLEAQDYAGAVDRGGYRRPRRG